MKPFAIAMGLIAAIAVTSYGLYGFVQSGQRRPADFQDWVKNPELKQELQESIEPDESTTVAEDVTAEHIHELIEGLYDRDRADASFLSLELLGSKAAPKLIEALNDARTANTIFAGSKAQDPTSPFDLITDLLTDLRTPEAAGPVAKYIDHQDSTFRKQAALLLGVIGTKECIEPIRRALGDEDDYVCSYAMIGMQRSISAGRRNQEFLEGIFTAFIPLLHRSSISTVDEAPQLMIAIDKAQAISILLSPEHFTADNRQSCNIIEALTAAEYKIPHDKLLPYLEAVRPRLDDYACERGYAAALIAYAHNPDASADNTFQAELRNPHESVRQAAAEALAITAGVTKARQFVFDKERERGFDRLSPPQQHYVAVFLYDAEVRNGGHSQFFVNSFGDNWQVSLAGLKAIGATKRAAILQEAVALFGKNGPSLDNSRRHVQLADFSADQDKALSELDDKYYRCDDESVDALLSIYATRNKSHFVESK